MEKRIAECKIMQGRFQNIISVTYDDGTVDDGIGSYYPDELYFTEDEFIGLTRAEARDLMHRKDVQYLRS